ncbi:glycosyltransferase family 2 protein [Spirosoma fluminis]
MTSESYRQNTPLISVITVTYNAANTLEQSILSVIKQQTNLEYLIIDGGSKDGTTDILRKYNDSISYWISESDQGIYDAMNKGIDMSKGQWLYFLGADDELCDGALNEVSKQLTSIYDVVFGVIRTDTGKQFSSSINLKMALSNTIHHQSAFYNRRLFDMFRYDTAQKIMSDYDLNLFIYKQKRAYKQINTCVAICGSSGISSVDKKSLHETNRIRSKHYNRAMNIIISAVLRLKYWIHYDLLRKI